MDERILTPKWHEVVRRHFRETLGLVVAQTGECLKIQRDEHALVAGRRFRPFAPDDLPAADLGPSWFVGILLCPGDDTQRVAAWALTLPRQNLSRIRFYHTAKVHLERALEAWKRAGLPDLPTFPVQGFRSFHRLYGRHHGDIVYRDATRAGA